MIHLPGRHNCENVMAAILAARACGCPPRSSGRLTASGESPTGSNTPGRKTASSSTTIPRGPTSAPSCGRWRASPNRSSSSSGEGQGGGFSDPCPADPPGSEGAGSLRRGEGEDQRPGRRRGQDDPCTDDERGDGKGLQLRIARRRRPPLAGGAPASTNSGTTKSGATVSRNGSGGQRDEKADRKRKKPDLILLLVTLLLVTVGTVMVYSSSSILAMERFRDGQFFLKNSSSSSVSAWV